MITLYWALGTSPTIWVLMAKTEAIIRSKPLSLFMYVISFTCEFGAFYEDMVVSLTRLTLSDL